MTVEKIKRQGMPRCHECGRHVHPERARFIKLPAVDHRPSGHLLAGIYCDADCAIIAWTRGWASWSLTNG